MQYLLVVFILLGGIVGKFSMRGTESRSHADCWVVVGSGDRLVTNVTLAVGRNLKSTFGGSLICRRVNRLAGRRYYWRGNSVKRGRRIWCSEHLWVGDVCGVDKGHKLFIREPNLLPGIATKNCFPSGSSI
jgi:hypothetical protein